MLVAPVIDITVDTNISTAPANAIVDEPNILIAWAVTVKPAPDADKLTYPVCWMVSVPESDKLETNEATNTPVLLTTIVLKEYSPES